MRPTNQIFTNNLTKTPQGNFMFKLFISLFSSDKSQIKLLHNVTELPHTRSVRCPLSKMPPVSSSSMLLINSPSMLILGTFWLLTLFSFLLAVGNFWVILFDVGGSILAPLCRLTIPLKAIIPMPLLQFVFENFFRIKGGGPDFSPQNFENRNLSGHFTGWVV